MEDDTPIAKISCDGYEIQIDEGVDVFNPDNDNVDVVVEFPDGRRYTATFFTLENVKILMENYKETGECGNGLYFWCSDMIIIERIDRGNIKKTVESLIETDEFFDGAFSGPLDDS